MDRGLRMVNQHKRRDASSDALDFAPCIHARFAPALGDRVKDAAKGKVNQDKKERSGHRPSSDRMESGPSKLVEELAPGSIAKGLNKITDRERIVVRAPDPLSQADIKYDHQ